MRLKSSVNVPYSFGFWAAGSCLTDTGAGAAGTGAGAADDDAAAQPEDAAGEFPKQSLLKMDTGAGAAGTGAGAAQSLLKIPASMFFLSRKSFAKRCEASSPPLLVRDTFSAEFEPRSIGQKTYSRDSPPAENVSRSMPPAPKAHWAPLVVTRFRPTSSHAPPAQNRVLIHAARAEGVLGAMGRDTFPAEIAPRPTGQKSPLS